jgi:hypothetical protein
MRLKATWSLLLLLLVSVQSFAATCEVRCGTMAMMVSASQMPGMANCRGMASQRVSDWQADVTVTSAQTCASHICKDDWTFLQSPVEHELAISLLPLTPSSSTTMPLEIAHPLQFKVNRSPHSIPSFDPLISSLRV